MKSPILQIKTSKNTSHQSCIYIIKYTVKTAILWNITILNNYFLLEYIAKCNLFLWAKLIFQHRYSSLQCHMILHFNMLIFCSRNIIINVERVKRTQFKRTAFILNIIEICSNLWNMLNVFNVTFDSFMHRCWLKCSYFYEWKKLGLKHAIKCKV